MMLRKSELDQRTVSVDGVEYTVTAFTVRQRTRFESAIVRIGTEAIRELLLIYCVSLDGQPAFGTDHPDCDLSPEQDQAVAQLDKSADRAALTEQYRLDNLVAQLAEFPAGQLQELVDTAQQVNGLLGNDSAPN